MLIEHGGNEQGDAPNVSEASDASQLDQAALEKKKRCGHISANITRSGERIILFEQKR
jgi:hypothetical protein